MQLLYNEYFNNTVLDYIIFLGSLILSCLAVMLIDKLIIRRIIDRIRSANSTADALLVKDTKKYLMPAVFITVIYLNTKLLHIDENWLKIINTVVMACVLVLLALFISSVAICLIGNHFNKKSNDSSKLALKWISSITKAVIWIIALILFLDNIGIKITSLITGLGIGGIAIAFAAQAVLTDIFCFFSILFDRPFEVGDYITVGELMGTVEHIGVKTTRLRSLNGEQLILSNTDLTNSRISNYKTLEQRRVLTKLGIIYNTPTEKLKEIPVIIKQVIENTPETQFGRAHFSEFGAYSLNFEIVYFILSNDYEKFMNVKQDVNLRIKAEFEAQGIALAYPTQTLLVMNTDSSGS